MSLKKICLLIASILIWTLASCGPAYPKDRVLPTPTVFIEALPEIPTRTPTLLLPTLTLSPTQPLPTATSTASPEPSPTAVEVDLNLATLRLEELPVGFEVLDEKSQSQAGLSPDKIRQLFSGIFGQALLVHSFSYVTSDPKKFEIVVGLVLSPIIAADQVVIDQMLTDPNGFMKNFAKNFGSEAALLSDLPRLGDSLTIGWGFTCASGQPPLRGEIVITRRDTIVTWLLIMFPSDQKPSAPVSNLARILNANVEKALKK